MNNWEDYLCKIRLFFVGWSSSNIHTTIDKHLYIHFARRDAEDIVKNCVFNARLLFYPYTLKHRQILTNTRTHYDNLCNIMLACMALRMHFRLIIINNFLIFAPNLNCWCKVNMIKRFNGYTLSMFWTNMISNVYPCKPHLFSNKVRFSMALIKRIC